MALLTAWTDDNKIIDSGLTISYSKSKVFGSWTATSTTASTASVTYNEAWEYRRFASGTFRYVGMDYDTSLRCAQAMVAEYSRPTIISKWDPTGQSMYNAEFIDVDGGTVLMADVNVQNTAGHMYEVVVQVREQDMRMRINGSAGPSSLFTTENQRQYPEFDIQ